MVKKPIEAEVIEQPAEPAEQTGLANIASSMSNTQLKKAVEKETERRQIIGDFVKSQLKEGVDYGKISSEKNGKSFVSKPTLFKPGQEKIFSLFSLTAICEKDTETLDMLGSGSGTVAYLCKVYKNGVQIAEGRGAATVGDNRRDANSTVKIAEKRARMDACLSLGFSEHFTQDMEDPEYRNQPAGNGQAESTAPPASPKQKNFILKMLKEDHRIANEKDQLAVVAHMAGIKEAKELTIPQASTLIGRLKDGELELPEGVADPNEPLPTDETGHVDVSGVDVGEPGPLKPGYMAASEGPTEPMVDAQYKQDVETKMQELKLTAQLRMRALKDATGKVTMPSTDGDWRKLSDHLDKLAEGGKNA